MLIYGNVAAALQKMSVITTHHVNGIEIYQQILSTQHFTCMCVCVIHLPVMFKDRTEFCKFYSTVWVQRKHKTQQWIKYVKQISSQIHFLAVMTWMKICRSLEGRKWIKAFRRCIIYCVQLGLCHVYQTAKKFILVGVRSFLFANLKIKAIYPNPNIKKVLYIVNNKI